LVAFRNEIESYVFDMNERLPSIKDDLLNSELIMEEQYSNAMEVVQNVQTFLEGDPDVNEDFDTYRQQDQDLKDACQLIGVQLE
jgi:molecular chaperone DnaK (HSP70)